VGYGEEKRRIMKVAFCHHYSMGFGAGGERLLAQLANRLSNDGFDIGIYSLPVARRGKMPILIEDVKYSEKWFHRIDADIADFIYTPFIEKFFKFRKKIPKIASIHGYPLVPELQHKSIRDISLLERIKKTGIIRSGIWWYEEHFRNFKGYDAIHIINPAMTQIFDKYKKTYMIPNWTDTELFSPNGEKFEKFTVIFVGRDDWVKGIDIYEEIARIAQENGVNDIEFWCTRNANGYCKQYGYIKDSKKLAYLYSRAHVLAYPTRIDTFGNVIIESLSCETPVISSGLPVHISMELPLLYADGIYDFLDKILSIKSLWENNRKEYERFCKLGREQVIDKYDFEKIYPKFVDMLQRVEK